jgi:hypothetical protein
MIFKKLCIPLEYCKLSEEEKKESNGMGCGPGKWGIKIVPSKLFGIDINECCKIHDFMWSNNDKTDENKRIADNVFLYNLINTIFYRYNNEYYFKKNNGTNTFYDDKYEFYDISTINMIRILFYLFFIFFCYYLPVKLFGDYFYYKD